MVFNEGLQIFKEIFIVLLLEQSQETFKQYCTFCKTYFYLCHQFRVQIEVGESV